LAPLLAVTSTEMTFAPTERGMGAEAEPLATATALTFTVEAGLAQVGVTVSDASELGRLAA
jgi:hypothetical protein